MKRTKRIIPVLRFSLSVLLPTLLVATVVYATGDALTPPSGTPAATSYTLNDIYTRLTTNTSATAGDHDLSTTTTPSTPFRSLSDIFSAIPTIDAMKVATGTSYLGVPGTLLGNIFNGSCNNPDDSDTACNFFNTAYPGGSQANGGVDDFNGYHLGGTPPSDRYSTTWTTCTSENNYCGTGDSGANAKDNATDLVWSYPCAGSGCGSWDTSDAATLTTGCLPEGACAFLTSDTLYSWNSSGGNNNSLTASQLCSGHTGWSLPHQKQLMQAYIDGSYGNLEPQGVYRYYWSATVVSFNNNYYNVWAWLVNLSDGYAYDNRSYSAHSVRCVR
jgi:hypothetical protein